MFEFRSVSDLNSYAGGVLESHEVLGSVSVSGELTGLSINRQSGHMYFSLKDSRAQVSCVMFSSYAGRLNFRPEDGIKVKIAGSCGLYAPYGKFQIKVTTMQREGTGDLMEQYMLLYSRLAEEGLFDADHKKPIPVLPRRIGVITSPTGAVIHDIINTLNRRNPHYDILLYPVNVQGEKCPGDVISGIEYFSKSRSVDVVIIARGGGSLEELFGFNDEELARKVYACDIPIISAVGHEINNTLCDAAADLRVPTPTAAAELVIAAYDDLVNDIANRRILLNMAVKNLLSVHKRRLDNLKNHKALYSPMFYVQKQRNLLDSLSERMLFSGNRLVDREKNRLINDLTALRTGFDSMIRSKQNELRIYIDRLDSLSPLNVLKRGYSCITRDDTVITSVKDLDIGQEIKVSMADGTVDVTVDRINMNSEEDI